MQFVKRAKVCSKFIRADEDDDQLDEFFQLRKTHRCYGSLFHDDKHQFIPCIVLEIIKCPSSFHFARIFTSAGVGFTRLQNIKEFSI